MTIEEVEIKILETYLEIGEIAIDAGIERTMEITGESKEDVEKGLGMYIDFMEIIEQREMLNLSK